MADPTGRTKEYPATADLTTNGRVFPESEQNALIRLRLSLPAVMTHEMTS